MTRRLLSGALGVFLRYALVIGTLGGVSYFWYVNLSAHPAPIIQPHGFVPSTGFLPSLVDPGMGRNDAAPPTPPGIRVTYHGGSTGLSLSRDMESGETE
jgi:hypothetical protein